MEDRGDARAPGTGAGRVYGDGASETLDRTVDVYVGRLREKLGDDPEHPRYIATVRGAGYRVVTTR